MNQSDYDFEEGCFLAEVACKIFQSGVKEKFSIAEEKLSKAKMISEKMQKRIDELAEWD